MPGDAQRLEERARRFLARVVDATLARGFRTAADFLASFPVGALLEALDDEPEVRAKLLVEGAGIPPRIAARRSALAAMEDLQLALEEGLTDPAKLLALVPPAVRSSALPAERLWSFATGGDWLARAEGSREEQARARARLRVVLEAALAEGLLHPRDLAPALPADLLVARLDEAGMRRALRIAVQAAARREPVSMEELVDTVDPLPLLDQLPVPATWEHVVLPRLAVPLGLVVGERAVPAERTRSRGGRRDSREPPRRPLPRPALVSEEIVVDDADIEEELTNPDALPLRVRSSEPPRPAAPRPAPAVPRPAPRPPPPRASDRPPPEGADAARRRALVSRLSAIGRLPANHEYLSVHILRAIARMYEELPQHRGKAARAQCIRACFDNEQHLVTALTALLGLIAPETEAEVSEAGADQLVDALLGAEKALWQRARGRRSLPGESALPAKRAHHVEAHAPPPARRR